AVSVLISGFAALTLSPMMCARMLGAGNQKKNDSIVPTTNWGKIKKLFTSQAWMAELENNYEEILKKLMTRRLTVALCAISIACLGYGVFQYLPALTEPDEDKGVIRIDGQAPHSSTMEYTERYVGKIDEIIAKIPELKRRVLSITNPSFEGTLELVEKSERKRSSKEGASDLEE
ncbi:efflux RND transporter permease subunit, partial [Dolichospermum sp. ST_sed4]|nr:efflux RND transporter permease subunit [Dolichospermum sp. ST_sed4]